MMYASIVIVVTQSGESSSLLNKQAEEQVMEEGELEGDTLDPQTGLFYRSSPSTVPPPQQRSTSSTQSEQGRHTPHSVQPQQSKAIAGQPSSSSTTAPMRVSHAQEPAPSKEKSLGSGSHPVVVLSMKPPHTPQLPKLQQAPTSHNRPNLHSPLSHPPPLQAHHPVGSEKTSSGQVSGHFSGIMPAALLKENSTFLGNAHICILPQSVHRVYIPLLVSVPSLMPITKLSKIHWKWMGPLS